MTFFLPLIFATTISLKNAETMALKDNPVVQFSEQDVKQHNYQRLQAVLSWLPDIKYGSMYVKLQKSQKISSSQRQTHLFSNQFELTQPIFSPTLLGDLKLSKIAYEGSIVAKEMTINETLFQIRTLYLSAVLKQRKLQAQRLVISYLNNVYTTEQKKQNFGSGTLLQTSQAKADLSKELTGYYNTAKEASDAKRQLVLMLHIDPTQEFHLEASLQLEEYPLLIEKLALLESSIQEEILNPANLSQPFSLFSEHEIEQWVATARRHRPELKKSQVYVQAAQEKSRQSKTEYLPTISAFADYGYYQPINGQFFRQRNDFAGGIQLSWSLFDSFKREAKILEIAALKKAAALAYQYENDRVAVTIRNDLHQIEENLLIYMTTSDNAKLASQALEETKIRHSLGSVNDIDLQNGQRLLSQAELQALEAEYNLLESYFQLRYDTGLDINF